MGRVPDSEERRMSISREVLAKFVTPGCEFIETGTRWGTTAIRAIDLGARTYFGVEVDWRYAYPARDMLCEVFARMIERDELMVNMTCAESRYFLPHLSTTYDLSTAVVFLDAHTDMQCPVLAELAAIKGWSPEPAAILVDDVRLFRSNHWGITLEQVIEAIDKIGKYEYSFETGAEPEDILVAKRTPFVGWPS